MAVGVLTESRLSQVLMVHAIIPALRRLRQEEREREREIENRDGIVGLCKSLNSVRPALSCSPEYWKPRVHLWGN
jgi:hypothetical protein